MPKKPLRASTRDYLRQHAGIIQRLMENEPPKPGQPPKKPSLSHMGGLHRSPGHNPNEPIYTAPPEKPKPPEQHKPTPPAEHKPPGAYSGHVPIQHRPDVEHGVCDHCHKGGPLTVTHDEKTVCWRGAHGRGGCHNRQRYTPPPPRSEPRRGSAWDDVK
jgi:hypothetical protein